MCLITTDASDAKPRAPNVPSLDGAKAVPGCEVVERMSPQVSTRVGAFFGAKAGAASS
jgi:hypothetical protein